MWIDVEYHIYIYDTCISYIVSRTQAKIFKIGRIPPCDGPVGKFDSWWESVTCLVEKVFS